MNAILPDIKDTGRYSKIATAACLDVSTKTIERWVANGVLKCGRHRHNGRMFFLGSEIKRFFKAEFGIRKW